MGVDKDMAPGDVYKEYSKFYDLYVGDRVVDLPFYLDYAKSAQTPVIEIGAGSGRLTLPLARAGVRMVAVDVSTSMLAILKCRLAEESSEVRRRVEVVEVDACELRLGIRSDLIMVPYYTFNYFLTTQVQGMALQRFRDHLSQRGCLLVDLFIPLRRIESPSTEPALIVDKIDHTTGNRVLGWETYRIDEESQMEYRTHRFEVIQPDGAVRKSQYTVQRRHFFRLEIEKLFSDHGFSVDDVSTGYEREQPGPGSEQLMYVLRPKQPRGN